MILRRVIEHVKKQEWTAVFLDFLIVVVGVFIGIQVSNWNAARADRVEERQLLMRLDDEARALLEIQKSEYAFQLPRFEAMIAIHPLLFDQTPKRALSDVECRLVAISHWLPAPTDELPILEEAIATGRFDLITNESVKANLRRFAVVRDRARRQYVEAINELYRLSPRHPDAVWSVRAPMERGETRLQWTRRAGDGYKWWNRCDLEKMRSDKAFLSEYADNISRLDSYRNRYEETISTLEDLGETLASELGRPHSSEIREAP